jgi:hypothetical protein
MEENLGGFFFFLSFELCWAWRFFYFLLCWVVLYILLGMDGWMDGGVENGGREDVENWVAWDMT